MSVPLAFILPLYVHEVKILFQVLGSIIRLLDRMFAVVLCPLLKLHRIYPAALVLPFIELNKF